MKKLGRWVGIALLPLWRWKWLLLVLLILTISYSLWSIEFTFTFHPSGTIIPPPKPNELQRQISHGWPLPYLWRDYDAELEYKRWTIWEEGFNHAWSGLCINLLVAVGISIALTYLAAWRYARSGGWRFGLRDLLAVIVIVAIPLAIVRSFENAHRADKNYVTQIQSHGFSWGNPWHSTAWYERPWQNLGLLSTTATSPQTLRFASPTVDFDLNSFLQQEVARGRRIQRTLGSLYFEDANLNDDGVQALTQWAPRVQRLSLLGQRPQFGDQAVAQIVDAWPSLQWITLGSDQLTPQSLQSFQRLNDLQRLDLFDCSRELTASDLKPLAELPRLETLYVPDFVFNQISFEERAKWKTRGIAIYPSKQSRSKVTETDSP